MAYREFQDSDGQSWRVWSTTPSTGTRLHGGFGRGWLTFECTSPEADLPLRRLCPIPPDWETMPEERLQLLCRTAEVAKKIERPRPGDSESEAR